MLNLSISILQGTITIRSLSFDTKNENSRILTLSAKFLSKIGNKIRFKINKFNTGAKGELFVKIF